MPGLREALRPLRPPRQAREGPHPGPALLVPGAAGDGHALKARTTLPVHPQQRGRQELHPEGGHPSLKRTKAKAMLTFASSFQLLSVFDKGQGLLRWFKKRVCLSFE